MPATVPTAFTPAGASATCNGRYAVPSLTTFCLISGMSLWHGHICWASHQCLSFHMESSNLSEATWILTVLHTLLYEVPNIVKVWPRLL